MKKSQIALALCALIGLSPLAHADDELMDARQADESTVYKRQVNYACQGGKRLSVEYGFNEQKLPTYAQISAVGKARFMPVNLAHSDLAGTRFGDDDNYSLASSALTLGNYHKSTLSTIQNPASDILYKSCQVKSVKKLR